MAISASWNGGQPTLIESAIGAVLNIPTIDVSVSGVTLSGNATVYVDWAIAASPQNVIQPNLPSRPSGRFWRFYNTGEMNVTTGRLGAQMCDSTVTLTVASQTAFSIDISDLQQFDVESTFDTNTNRFEDSSIRQESETNPLPCSVFTQTRYLFVIVTAVDDTDAVVGRSWVQSPIRLKWWNEPATDAAFALPNIRVDEYPIGARIMNEQYVSTLRDTRITYEITSPTKTVQAITVGGYQITGAGDTPPSADMQFYAVYTFGDTLNTPLLGNSGIVYADALATDNGGGNFTGNFYVAASQLNTFGLYRFVVTAYFDDGDAMTIRSGRTRALPDPTMVSPDIAVAVANYNAAHGAINGNNFVGVAPNERIYISYAYDKTTFNDRASGEGLTLDFDQSNTGVEFYASSVRITDDSTLTGEGGGNWTAIADSNTTYQLTREFRVPKTAAGSILYLYAVARFKNEIDGRGLQYAITQETRVVVNDGNDAEFQLVSINDDDGQSLSPPFCIEDTTYIDLCFTTAVDANDYTFFVGLYPIDQTCFEESDESDSPVLPMYTSDVISIVDNFDDGTGCVRVDTAYLDDGREYCVDLFATRNDVTTGGGSPTCAVGALDIAINAYYEWRKTGDGDGSQFQPDTFELNFALVFRGLNAGFDATEWTATGFADASSVKNPYIFFSSAQANIAWSDSSPQVFKSGNQITVIFRKILANVQANEFLAFINDPTAAFAPHLDFFDFELNIQNGLCEYQISGSKDTPSYFKPDSDYPNYQPDAVGTIYRALFYPNTADDFDLTYLETQTIAPL